MQLKLLFCVVLETFSPERRGLMKEMKTHTLTYSLRPGPTQTWWGHEAAEPGGYGIANSSASGRTGLLLTEAGFPVVIRGGSSVKLFQLACA